MAGTTLIRRRASLAAWILAVGAGSTVILIATDRLGRDALARQSDHGRALAEIQVAVATFHLWLEEYVTGDAVDLDLLQWGLDRSLSIARRLAGGPTLAALPSLTSLGQSDRGRAGRLAWRIEEFRVLSAERKAGFVASRRVGVGSAIDVVYDSVFGELMDETKSLAADLEIARRALSGRSATVFWGIVFTWAGLVASVALGVRKRERRRLETEAALATSRDQLAQTQKLEIAGRVASGLAHDLNNYLAAIRGHCELVKKKLTPESPGVKRMDGAIRVIEKSAGLISRLQAFAQTDPPGTDVIAPNGVVEDLLRIMKPSVGEQISLETQLDPELWSIEVNGDQLEQAVVNLLVNARDALTGKADGEIVIRTRNIASSDAGVGALDKVEIAISDNGPGIAREIRDRLFEPFATTRSNTANSGLGLAIVYGFVRAHEGSVEVSSEPGAGATFRLLLPRSEKKPPVAKFVSEEEILTDLSGSEKILLVDDHDDLRATLADLLTVHGYEVCAVADALQAEEQWTSEREPFDLVVTDLVLPGVNGYELIRRLRERGEVAAILMSGHRQDVIAAFAAKGANVFRKSGDPTELLAEIRRQLDGAEST